jgi:hypothetical protein
MAVAAFVVLLLGMHRRLSDARDDLVRAAARPQRVLVDELRAAIDAQ